VHQEQAEALPPGQGVRVTLLGPFSVSVAGRSTGAWPRPTARRLCELVLVSPDRRISRDLACEELFGHLDPRAASRSVSKALSLARATLAAVGGPAPALLGADLVHIWASPSAEVDAEVHEAALRSALSMTPGTERDALLAATLAEARQLLADEPYADWAQRPRERLEMLRQEARLTLARDRTRGAGRSDPDAVAEAWAACFEHDPANEEAAGALVRAYVATGRRQLAASVYEQCVTAFAELGLGIPPSLTEVYTTAAFTASPAPPPPPAEELRTVTVLSAEIAGQAGPAGKQGLEAVRELVNRCLAVVVGAAEAFGGTVISISGSGLQAVFGAPEAHEDDPERAIRAAFRAQSAVSAAARDRAQVLTIGVETGPALLGPIGAGGKVEYGAVGDAVALAAALRGAASAGSVLVGPATRAATSHLFTWGGIEQVALSADSALLTGTYLGKPRAAASGRRLAGGGRGSLVGRAPELATLATAMREVVGGHGSVVMLIGEPGLGKTRLVQECRKSFLAGARSGGPPLWLEGRCASYASATPYGLYQHVLASWIGVAPDQPEAVVRPALERALETVMGDTSLLPPLARMMGLAPGSALGRMGPEDIQRAIFAALRSVLSRLVAAGPAVLALEDLHWADPTSLQLTRDLAGLSAGRRLLVLITSRPEAEAELSGLAVTGDVRRLLLTPLSAGAERQLARSLVGGDAPQEVLDAVLANADGNPLFLEERLASLLETSALVQDQGQWRLRDNGGPEVPQVLERLVRSRVDRLSPPAGEAIRVAAVLGTQFPRPLLAAVLGGRDADDPDAAVNELLARDLLEEVAGPAEVMLRFRHALIQEAVYEGLLRARRRQLHGRAAWALAAMSSERLEDGAAVLGRHFAAAGEAEQALRYLEIAGDYATAAFANDEAISSFRAAMAVVDEQQANREAMTDAAVGLRAKIANVLWRTGRRSAAREAFQDALSLAGSSDTLRRAQLLTRLGRLEMAEQQYEAAAEALDSAEKLLAEHPVDSDDAVADAWLEMMVEGRADLYAVRNQPEQALAALEVARPVLEARGSLVRKSSFYHVLATGRVIQNRYRVSGDDLATVRKAVTAAAEGGEEKDLGYATFFVGWFLSLRGDLAGAREQFEASLDMADRIGESLLHVESLIGLALVAIGHHDTETARACTGKAMAVAEATDGSRHLAKISACQAWLAWQDGRPEDLFRKARQATEQPDNAIDSFVYYRWIYLWPLVTVHLDAGETGAAVAAARHILHPSQQLLPDRLMELTGQACQAWDDGKPEAARELLDAALALARALGYIELTRWYLQQPPH
jgi:class 3 adenylate cyclase/tetratricopeptide (TPR) repeat protein